MRVLHTPVHGYDDQSDSWFGFDSPEKAQSWVAEAHEVSKAIDTEKVSVSVAPAFNAYSFGVTCPAAPATLGPVVQLAQADEGRMRLLVSAIVPAGSYLLVGTREAVLAGQGYPLPTAAQLDLKNSRAVWAALALGSATGPLVGTVGVLTESLVG